MFENITALRRTVQWARWIGVIGLLVVGVSPVFAQENALQQCREAFQSADFQLAADLCTQVVEQETTDRDTQKEALQYLGRIYAIQQMNDRAREAIQRMLELEPPIVEPNPDVEPIAFMKLYYDVRKGACNCYTVEHDPGLQTMAIIDFLNSSIDDFERFDPMRWGFASMLINYLSGTTGLKVVERERLNWLLEELELNQSDLVDPSARNRTGQLLGATTMLTGSFIVMGRQISVWARLIKTETGEVLLAEDVKGRASEISPLLEELSLKIARAINLELDKKEVSVRTQTNSLDAMISYAEGLEYERVNDFRAANEKFREALAYDPEYERAKLKLESTDLMLASR